MSSLKTKLFCARPQFSFPDKDLVAIQLNSYKWFLEKGLHELFEEISPIRDHTGEEFELHFLNYKFDLPKYSEAETKEKDQTYEGALRVNLKLINKKTKEHQTQEVYFGDFPMMTDRGTFIINGVERVIVSQLIRSAGTYFTAEAFQGRKLFGAKIIPNRGAWLEFLTESNGFIGVKIDRKRKAPVTQLLRVFSALGGKSGLRNSDEIKSLFTDVDNGKYKFIETTLKKDEVVTNHSLTPIEDSFVEIYKRQRPGDLATAEGARSLIEPIFTRFDRYDLSRVGRYKTNKRLNFKDNKTGGLLDLEDILAIVREIIRLNNSQEEGPDDIDHLGNRRVRAVGELVQSVLRVGFSRLKRNIQDKMSTLDKKDLQPVQLINYKVLTAVVRDFFSSSQLSQFMDQINPLAELEHKRRLSVMGPGGITRERAGFEIRDVHPSFYGRICPIQTPEGANIGLVSYLANHVRVNDFGFLESPYYRVAKGKVTDDLVWLDAIEEEKHIIAPSDIEMDGKGNILDKQVPARVCGKAGNADKLKVDLIDVSPNEFTSISTSLIPFLEHDDATRALMGSNMQRQAVPSIRPAAPIVSTGQEEKAATYSKQMIISDVGGIVTEVDAQKITVKTKEGKSKTFPVLKFKRSNQSTCFSHYPVVNVGNRVKAGTLLADSPSTKDGVLALGQNLLVAFISFNGGNFEDAIILSERVAREDFFTSVHNEVYTCSVRDTKLGPERTTPDIPNVAEDKLRNLDEDGIIRIGAEVRPNDILVGKISPKGESELTSEEKLLQAIFGEKAKDVKDTSLTMPHGKTGRVIRVKIFSRDKGDKLEPGIIKKIQIEVAQLRKIRAGDKLAGRHGNKGVISQVRPIEDMPYLADGTPVDVVLNPLGVASRMNLGQILETHLGLTASTLGYRAIVPNFVSLGEESIKKELIASGLPETGKLTLYDGLTGESFREPVTVGYAYIMKLSHLVEDKLHMRSTGPYSLITQQPLGGKAQLGGQRFGEMEVWALEGYGAAHTLQEMLTIKSDDVLGRSAAFEAIIRGQEIRKPNLPASFNVLVSELKSLGLNIISERNSENTEGSVGETTDKTRKK